MRRTFLILTIVLSTCISAVALFLGWDLKQSLGSLPKRELQSLASVGESSGGKTSAPQEKLKEMAAEAEGATPETGMVGGHGAAAPVKAKQALVTMEEIFVNIGDSKGPVRSLGVKLDLELFDNQQVDAFDKHQAGVRNTVIIASRAQDFKKLSTVQGKLYFKEHLIAAINEYLQQPIVRDIHFASFFLQ
jgi:flagellar basal body-associated protein FliL